jgi:hypothetical protein
MKKIFAFLFLLTFSFPAQAGVYAQQCPKIYLFHIPAGKQDQRLKGFLQNLCSCQENELLKAGVSDDELKAFVKNAGSEKLDPATIAVSPKINNIINSGAVKSKCGSFGN